MNQIRLLPIVLFAAVALLILKTVGLVTDGQYVLSGTEFAVAQSQSGIDENIQLTPQEEAAALRAADSLFSNTASAPVQTGENMIIATVGRNGESIPIEAIDENDLTERAVLERLSQRRTQLEVLSDELDLRADLVAAAELRLNERMAALEIVEARVQSLVDQFDAKADEQFISLVSMYEGMKSSDAAKVFNMLDSDVLLRLASNMSPRKMSPILADMDAARAQELPIRLATLNEEVKIPDTSSDMSSSALPQIVGQ